MIPVPQQEQNELNDSSQPDVDPGGSKGPDAPIVKQEGEQLNNSASLRRTARLGGSALRLGDRALCRHVSWKAVVLPLRIELRTSPLPRECSTTELRQLEGLPRPV